MPKFGSRIIILSIILLTSGVLLGTISPNTSANELQTFEITNGVKEVYLSPEISDQIQSFDITGEYNSYAFAWTQGKQFTYSWDGEVFLIPEGVDGGKDNAKTDKDFSDLFPKRHDSDTLFIRGNTADEIVLNLYKEEPTLETGLPSFDLSSTKDPIYGYNFAAQGQVNLASGANYSELDIVKRNEWGANENDAYWDPEYYAINKIVLHHTVWTSTSDYPAVIRQIFNYHAVTLGWGDIGYNYLIDPNGVIYEGRKGGASVVGAHAYTHNNGSVGIALIGDFTSEMPTQAALDSLEDLMVERALLHGIDLVYGTTVFGHKDLSNNNTACPGDTLHPQLGNITADAKTELDSQSAGTIATARTNTLATLSSYTDSRLRLEFTNTSLSESEMLALVPTDSGILRVEDISNGKLTIVTESMYGSYDNTDSQVRLLHLIFSLDPEFSGIELLDIPDILDFKVPITGGSLTDPTKELELKFTEPILAGSGSLEIRKQGDNSLFQQIDVASASISGRTVTIPHNQLDKGESYYVTICTSCFSDLDVNLFPGLSDQTWNFSVERITQPVYRFYSAEGQSHFFTMSSKEKDKLINDSDFNTYWDYEGIAFYAFSKDECDGDQVPIYRFWGTTSRSHFYTASYTEYQKLVSRPEFTAHWDYEGIAYCAHSEQEFETSPLYRFYGRSGSHFFTISTRERDKLLTKDPYRDFWDPEGIAYYVFPTP